MSFRSARRRPGASSESSALGGPPVSNGELHPDAGELLYLVSGCIRVRLELEDGDRETEVRPGRALVIPPGTASRAASAVTARISPGELELVPR